MFKETFNMADEIKKFIPDKPKEPSAIEKIENLVLKENIQRTSQEIVNELDPFIRVIAKDPYKKLGIIINKKREKLKVEGGEFILDKKFGEAHKILENAENLGRQTASPELGKIAYTAFIEEVVKRIESVTGPKLKEEMIKGFGDFFEKQLKAIQLGTTKEKITGQFGIGGY